MNFYLSLDGALDRGSCRGGPPPHARTRLRRALRCGGPPPPRHPRKGRRRETSDMPELPEVEITARRLNTALVGASVESAVAPGMNVMKTFEPPLEALVGRKVTGLRRVGKMPVVEYGDLALLIHLMSAGRLRLFDKRASAKDRASRVLVRLEDGRELRLRELGTKQRAW